MAKIPRWTRKEDDISVKEVMTDLAGGSRPLSYERDGLSLAYSLVGDGEPILFVHGATATGEFGRASCRERVCELV